jgi:hypothetical protein
VAAAFVTNRSVVFDLYNEPHDISWSCWLKGCQTAGGWTAAGMQSLVEAVRSTGASQPLILDGDGWGGDLKGWLSHEPIDPRHALVAGAHIYDRSRCNSASCWNDTLAAVGRSVPVVTGELGEWDCTPTFVQHYMDWADAHGISYLAWAWVVYQSDDCRRPVLVADYSGTPTPYGAGVRSHLLALAAP